MVGKVSSVTSPLGWLRNSSHSAVARSSAIATSAALRERMPGAGQHAAADAFGERHARLALEHLELLGDGRGVRPVASATAVTLPRSPSSRSRSRRLTSM